MNVRWLARDEKAGFRQVFNMNLSGTLLLGHLPVPPPKRVVNRNTAILYFHKPRELVAEKLVADAPDLMAGEIEVDESYIGGVRKGKRGRGAAGKIPVFGLLKRGGRV